MARYSSTASFHSLMCSGGQRLFLRGGQGGPSSGRRKQPPAARWLGSWQPGSLPPYPVRPPPLIQRGAGPISKDGQDAAQEPPRNGDRKSELHTDEALAYHWMGKKLVAKHRTVNHSQDEYFKDGIGVQSAETFFAILKRGVGLARFTASACRPVTFSPSPACRRPSKVQAAPSPNGCGPTHRCRRRRRAHRGR
jgi:hypothetical protein